MYSFESFQNGLRALKIWRTLIVLIFLIWWDSQPFTYTKGCNETNKSYRQKIRARWITKELVKLGSAFIKLGQLLSARPDILTNEWVESLATLQDKVPPFDFNLIKKILHNEIGQNYNQIVKIDEIPIGAASLAQVHRAYLNNRKEVVLKVQRPGLEKLFRLDLEVMQQVAKIVQRNKNWSQGRDWVGISKECRRVLLRELDFRIEAQYAARFRQQFLEDNKVLIPKVIWNLSSQRVICLEYLPGIKINDVKALKENGIDPSKVAEIGAMSYLKQLVEFGFFHADPHPGNLAVSSNGSIIYYDFGMMGVISVRIRNRINAMIKAAALRDASALVEELKIAGLISSEMEVGPVRRLVRLMLKETLTPPFSSNILEKLSGDIYDLVYGRPFRLPVELIFVIRALSTFEGVGRNLDPSFNLVSIAKPYLLPIMNSNNSNDFINEIGRQFSELGIKAVALPKRLDDNLERLEQGDLQLQIRMGESDRQFRRMINAQQAMGQSILLGSLGITAALLHSSTKPFLSTLPILIGSPILLNWIKLQLKLNRANRLDKIQGKQN